MKQKYIKMLIVLSEEQHSIILASSSSCTSGNQNCYFSFIFMYLRKSKLLFL